MLSMLWNVFIDFLTWEEHAPFCTRWFGDCRKEKHSLATKTLRAWAAARQPDEELREDDEEMEEVEEAGLEVKE